MLCFLRRIMAAATMAAHCCQAGLLQTTMCHSSLRFHLFDLDWTVAQTVGTERETRLSPLACGGCGWFGTLTMAFSTSNRPSRCASLSPPLSACSPCWVSPSTSRSVFSVCLTLVLAPSRAWPTLSSHATLGICLSKGDASLIQSLLHRATVAFFSHRVCWLFRICHLHSAVRLWLRIPSLLLKSGGAWAIVKDPILPAIGQCSDTCNPASLGVPPLITPAHAFLVEPAVRLGQHCTAYRTSISSPKLTSCSPVFSTTLHLRIRLRQLTPATRRDLRSWLPCVSSSILGPSSELRVGCWVG